MVFNSELGGKPAASKYVCACEQGLALGAYEVWTAFSIASLDA